MNYQSTWESLKQFQTPKWLREGKFGIYTHWGVYSVPACRPNGSWYPRNMYIEGTPQNEYHKKTYGDPSVFGYKDFIPMFTGEKFDAEEWADLFQKAGAKFAGPVGEHHDGFAMWDTSYSRWNSAKMGPKVDVVAALEKAIRARDMKFMVAMHHIENHYFFPHSRTDCDIADEAYADLYGELHDLDRFIPENLLGEQARPSKKTLDIWLGKTKEIIDRFSPDALWFDFGLQYVQEHYKRDMISYFYNEAVRKGQEPLLMYKNNDIVVGAGLIDLELGRFDRLMHNEWITDTTVDDGEGWCYLFDARYKSPRTLVHYLIDNVSKNGYLLLNVGPKPNGEIPEEAKHILLEMGRWLELNGEAIYGTTPWRYHGEGPTQMASAGNFTESENLVYTPADIRYTAKEDNIYAICFAWPENGAYVLERLKTELYEEEIARISMLGSEKDLQWHMGERGLVVKIDVERPCDYAYVLKVERKRPF